MVNELIKWGFFIYLGIIPLIPDTINSKYRIMDIYLVLLVFVYLINMLVNYDRRNKLCNDLKKFFKDSIVIFMLIVIVLMGVSTVYSVDRGLALQETIRFGTYIAILYYFVSEIDIKKDLGKVVRFIYYPAFIIGVLGVIQFITGKGITRYANGVARIVVTLDNPNTLGMYFIVLLFPLVMIAFYEKRTVKKVIIGLVCLLFILNIAFSFSRNAWLALVVGICILTIIYNWKFIIGLFIAGAGVLLYPPLSVRIVGLGKAVMNDGRLKHWGIALEMFKDKPLTGVGNGNYVTLHSQYVKLFPKFIVPGEENYPTHNSYFKILSELGILGFIPFMLLHTTIFIRSIKVCKLYSEKYKGLIKGLIVALLIFFQANLLDNMWFVPKVTFLYWIIVGILILLYRNKKAAK